MSASKKPARVTCYEIGQPLEDMPISAKVFANYVLVPPARLPDGDTRAGRFQGAALLIFIDQPAQEVQLTTRYAALVTRDTTLDTAENRSDKIVSSHLITPSKEVPMTAKIACTVCHALIQPGATHCPGCSLPLVAQAVPVIEKRKKSRASLWLFIGLVLVLCAILSAVNQSNAHQDEKKRDALQASLAAGEFDTPSAFQSRCGSAPWSRSTKTGTELHYRVNQRDYFITFESQGPKFQREQMAFENGKPNPYRLTMDPAELLSALECK